MFNVICGISSLLGLALSVFLAFNTASIKKTVNKSLVNERFRVNYKNIMESLDSTGKNAIRDDFPNFELIYEFETELRSYQKSYSEILSQEEQAEINLMLELIFKDPIPKREFFRQLSKITSKRPSDKED